MKNAYFLIFVVWVSMAAGNVLAKDGERKEGTYDFGSTFIGAILLTVLVFLAIKKGF